MSRLPKTYDSNSIEQSLRDYEDLILGKACIDLDAKDIKLDHKIREQFDSEINQIDAHLAKILLRIKVLLVNGSWDFIKYDDSDYVNLLQSYLSEFPDPIKEYYYLTQYKTDNLLSDYYIKWFGNNLRRSLFLASLVEKYLEGETYEGELELIEGISDYFRYKSRRFSFDSKFKLPKYQLVSYEDPEEDVKSRHIELVKATYLDNHVSDKDIKWIVPSDAEQIEWAYDYLEKEKQREKEKRRGKDESIAEDEEEENKKDEAGNEESYIPLKRVFFPQNTQEKYELILATIDRISNVEDPPFSTNAAGSYSERAYVLHKMQNAWSKRVPSDKVISSNEVTVKLSKKSRDRLNKLPGNSKAEIDKFINKCIEEYVKEPS